MAVANRIDMKKLKIRFNFEFASAFIEKSNKRHAMVLMI